MCIFHKWGKWEQYELITPEHQITRNYGFCAMKEYRQKRICKKCGKCQDEYINSITLD